jgi:hypothetical protein
LNPSILNRDFTHPTDGWYQIEVTGEHPNSAAGLTQIIDEASATAIANSFKAEATAYPAAHNGTEFPGMLIDRDHLKHQATQPTTAYGWLTNIEARPGGLFGQIRWTATGKAAVDGGDYRFFSTEYNRSETQVVNGDSKRVRPMRLDGLTLTNEPNNKGGRPITNRLPDDQPSPGTPPKKENTTMKTVADKLGLNPDAAEPAVLDAVVSILNRVAKAESDQVKLTTEVGRLTGENKGLKNRRVEDALGRLDNDEKIRNAVVPAIKDSWKRMLEADYEGALPLFNAFLDSLTPKETPKPGAGGVIVNRGGGNPPVGAEQAEEEKLALDFATTINNRAKGVKVADAMSSAIRINPEARDAWNKHAAKFPIK